MARGLPITMATLLCVAGCDRAQFEPIPPPPPMVEPGALPLPPGPLTDDPDALARVWVLRDIELKQSDEQGGRWRQLGWDLDGRCSYPPDAGSPSTVDAGTNVDAGPLHAGWDIECLPFNEGDRPPPDGDDCRDNNFGRIAGVALAALTVDPEEEVDDSLRAGRFALMVRVFDYDGTADDPQVYAELVQSAEAEPEGGVVGDPLAWDGTDTFYPIAGSFDAITGRARVFDPGAYVRDGRLVMRIPPGRGFTLGGTNITLELVVTDGTLSGLIRPDGTLGDVVLSARWAVTDIIGALDELGICEEDFITRTTATALIQGAADVLANPEAVTGTLIPCDAISVALGFTGYPGRWGKPARAARVVPNLCERPDAGPADAGPAGDLDAGVDAGI